MNFFQNNSQQNIKPLTIYLAINLKLLNYGILRFKNTKYLANIISTSAFADISAHYSERQLFDNVITVGKKAEIEKREILEKQNKN